MDRIDAEGVAEWIRAERVTEWNRPPALLHSLADAEDIPADHLASLDEVWTGGADCPEVIRSTFAAKYGLPVLATYGLTEAPSVVAIDHRSGDDHASGASGRPLPHLRIRIRSDDGEPVATGETGEICVGAADDRYRPMLGYWNRPEATAATVVDGELRTGDVRFLDPQGRLHVRDRKSLVIIRGGANVYPAEVERVLLEDPAIPSRSTSLASAPAKAFSPAFDAEYADRPGCGAWAEDDERKTNRPPGGITARGRSAWLCDTATSRG